MGRQRITTLAMCGVGAALLAIASLSHGWFSHTGEERVVDGKTRPASTLGIGLLSVGDCRAGMCSRDGYDGDAQPDERGKAFITAAGTTLLFALLAAGVLFVCALISLRQTSPRWLGWPAVVFSGLALGGGLAVAKLKPAFFQIGERTRWMVDQAEAGWAIPVFVVGAVLAMAAGISVAISRSAAG